MSPRSVPSPEELTAPRPPSADAGALLGRSVDGWLRRRPCLVLVPPAVRSVRRMGMPLGPLRPTRPHRQLPGVPHGQESVLTPPAALRGLRMERPAGREWGVAEALVRVRRDRDG